MTAAERVRTGSSVQQLIDATRTHRQAAEAHAQLRQALTESSTRLRTAQQDRDDAVRAARADGLTYRELTLVTGYSRGWLDRIISHRMDRHSRHR